MCVREGRLVSLNAKSDYGSCWSVNGIPGGYCRGTYFVSLPVRRGCIREERECSRRRLASNVLLACRRFKRRACCAVRGTAHCNRLHRLQSSRSLHSYRLFSAGHCLSSFMFLSTSPTLGRIDSRYFSERCKDVVCERNEFSPIAFDWLKIRYCIMCVLM